MTRNTLKFRLNQNRSLVTIVAAGVVFTVFYAMFLAYQEKHAAAELAALQKTDPTSYLEYIRKLEGFDHFLPLFTKYQHFDELRADAPAFMIGRWTLRPQPERMSSLGSTDCTDPITFGYGRVEVPRDGFASRAQFRIDGGTLIVSPVRSDPIPVKLISFGAGINHLELTPPGRDATYYAYPCGS